jgi:hypothetical protein
VGAAAGCEATACGETSIAAYAVEIKSHGVGNINLFICVAPSVWGLSFGFTGIYNGGVAKSAIDNANLHWLSTKSEANIKIFLVERDWAAAGLRAPTLLVLQEAHRMYTSQRWQFLQQG